MTTRSALLCCALSATLFACSEQTQQAGPATTGDGASASSAGSGGGSTTATGSGGSGGNGGNGGNGGSGGMQAACTTNGLMAGEHQMEIAFDGHDREYEVQVPTSYDGVTRVPMVFDIHGYTESMNQQQDQSGFEQLAEAQGFVVVRPNGFGNVRSFNAGDECCGTAQSQGLDDVGLMRAIAAEVMSLGCIDSRRIYATGLSNGGAMSHRLACEAADLFAAVAPVSYPIDFDPLSQCQPSRPIGMMHLHGSADFLVPINGSFIHQSTHDSFAYWAQVNGCSGVTNTSYSMGGSECQTYDSCNAGVKTFLCIINGPHHLYDNSDNVAVAQVAYDFLIQHRLP